VTIIVAGTYRIPLENLEGLRPHMKAVVEATQAEEGCLVYSYADDMLEPGLIRVFEIWRDQAAIDFHFATQHMKTWQTERAKFGLFERAISSYEIASQHEI
jgi:quinol monooxygenase YgiN